MGKPKKKMKIGSIDNEIIKAMNAYKNERNPYIKASRVINKGFTPKQILCHDYLCEDEKLWVQKYKNIHPYNDIKWKQLIFDLKVKSDDVSFSPQVSSPQDSNSPKIVQLSPQDNNVSITVITFKKDKFLKR
ncbi:hypothetical protein C1646_768915 [Rhizophagus diaphanus]|nr:hypothetical protein C1646_768915 [Rhizophagus diaphanus] [Rhizophagus sp. MUCL 43196]